jgi:hypothetical protein
MVALIRQSPRTEPAALAHVKPGQPRVWYHLRDFISDLDWERLAHNLAKHPGKMARIRQADI